MVDPTVLIAQAFNALLATISPTTALQLPGIIARSPPLGLPLRWKLSAATSPCFDPLAAARAAAAPVLHYSQPDAMS
jgi:hypothetical protein